MKVLLTGATGFIGSHTAEMLLRKGYQVRCLVRPGAKTNFLKQLTPPVELVEGSLENPLRNAVFGVDAIIHCAGLIRAKSPDEFEMTNVAGTHALLEAAKKYAPSLQRFVLVSSLAACGAALNNSIAVLNEIEAQPISDYGRSKLHAEIIARKYAGLFPVTIIRPSVVYGPRDVATLAFFKLIERGFIPLIQGGLGAASTIYVTDVAAALVKAIEVMVPSGHAYFLEDGATMIWRERYYQLSKHGPRNKHIEIPLPNFCLRIAAWLNENYGRLRRQAVFLTRDKLNELNQLYWVCSSQAAQRDLLWQPSFSWLAGTKLTYDWYKKEGWL